MNEEEYDYDKAQEVEEEITENANEEVIEETTTEESTTEENTYCSEADHKYRYTTCDYATLEKDGKSAMVCIV